MTRYTCLEPAVLGKMTLKNRLILPPMVTNYATARSGVMTGQYIDYLEERAQGGVGLITVEATSVHPSGRGFLRGLAIDADFHIPGLRRLTDRLHKWGAKAAIQLHHAGRETSARVTGQPIVAPSDCPVAYSTEPVRPLTPEDLDVLANAYAQGACRAREAGFDAVQIHGAHGYLLTQFLSPYTNKRTDEYGGSMENRLRFPLEVIRRVRKAVGDDFTVTFRMTVDEGLPDGLTLEESCLMAPILARSGIDAIHVVAGNYATGDHVIPVQACPMCFNENRAGAIRKAVAGAVPVITAGRIKSVPDAERLITEGKADFVALGRALIADPFLPRKTLQGQQELIRPCISCKEACEAHVGQGLEIGCILNPRVGEEGTWSPEALAATPKRVTVVGAGPAGLEAACTTAERGHSVDLYDQADAVGGMLNLADKPPFKAELTKIVDWYKARLARAGVRVHLGQRVDAGFVSRQSPDTVIVAVGAVPFVPTVPGAGTMPCCSALDVLAGKATVGRKVVIVGGGQVGVETAEALATSGHSVTILEILPEMAASMEPIAKMLMMRRFAGLDITLCPDTAVSRLDKGAVHTVKNGTEAVIKGVDTVVWATGFRPDAEARAMFQSCAPQVLFAGDCVRPANIEQAVSLAYRLAYSV